MLNPWVHYFSAGGNCRIQHMMKFAPAKFTSLALKMMLNSGILRGALGELVNRLCLHVTHLVTFCYPSSSFYYLQFLRERRRYAIFTVNFNILLFLSYEFSLCYCGMSVAFRLELFV